MSLKIQDSFQVNNDSSKFGGESNDTFNNVTQPPITGRLQVTIVEGRKINVSNFQARPYCVVEFEHNEFVTREAMRDSDLLIPRDFLDLVRAATSPVWKQKAVFDVARLDGEVCISVYERVHDNNCAQPEIFLGMLKIQPLRRSGTIDNWFKLLPRGKETVTGEIRVQISYEKVEVEKSHLTPASFEILKFIGKGNFGKVLQVRKKDTNRIYAMKILHKQDLIERRGVEHALAERNILIQAEACPFLVGLKFSFQTHSHLYLVTNFMNGGDLSWHLQNEGRFSEERAKFYAAEIVLALEHLHKHNIVYRDLKPENILLDATGHIVLCDFGLCKENLAAGQTTNTLCGTPEYIAPEVLAKRGYDKSVDWWSLGILLYEMIAGFRPFITKDIKFMYRRTSSEKLKFPRGFFSNDAKCLIKSLLKRNPHKRLGSHNDAEEIKNHIFFTNINWNDLYQKLVLPSFKPNVSSEDDVSCFDPAFIEEETNWPSIFKNLSRSSRDVSINSETNEAFGGFTYFGRCFEAGNVPIQNSFLDNWIGNLEDILKCYENPFPAS